ncbi:MAG: DUF1697 domain-containing protein [Ilumatobacteraceae bacterium]|jgi:uncharacterized protein (DUF1697 family)|nr:DUF1697 domain-containing protein [Ilumatobacteraceae bacterium]
MTTRMFAFLRAINTGGRRLTNADLLEPFRTAGLHDVAAYQAAGNVAFRCDRDPREVEGELAHRLSTSYGFDTPTFVRTVDEVRALLAELPFGPSDVAPTQGRTQVTFLASVPTPEQIAAAMALVPDDDLVAFAGRHWYWLPRGTISGSALPVTRIERVVGTMTMRTLTTLDRMVVRFGD